MRYAHIIDGAVAEYPLSKRQVRQAFYPHPVGDAVFEQYAAEHGYVPVTIAQKPETTDAQNAVLAPPALVDGGWIRLWEVTDASAEEQIERFASRQADKRRNIESLRDARFRAGFTVPSGPLAGKLLQVGTVEDRTNWLTSQAAYSAAVAQGAGAVEGANFRSADNETITVTYLEGLTALLSMAAWGASVMARSWVLKDAVNAAADKAALDAIDITADWP